MDALLENVEANTDITFADSLPPQVTMMHIDPLSDINEQNASVCDNISKNPSSSEVEGPENISLKIIDPENIIQNTEHECNIFIEDFIHIGSCTFHF